jgi:alcohol dehydrogenase (cytochrome c)
LFVFFFRAGVVFAGQDSAASRIENADKEPQNWLSFYGNYRGWSYSGLKQIKPENVKQLLLAWAFPAGFPPPNVGLKAGLEATPLVVDGGGSRQLGSPGGA